MLRHHTYIFWTLYCCFTMCFNLRSEKKEKKKKTFEINALFIKLYCTVFLRFTHYQFELLCVRVIQGLHGKYNNIFKGKYVKTHLYENQQNQFLTWMTRNQSFSNMGSLLIYLIQWNQVNLSLLILFYILTYIYVFLFFVNRRKIQWHTAREYQQAKSSASYSFGCI